MRSLYGAYLKQFPNGISADKAKNRIAYIEAKLTAQEWATLKVRASAPEIGAKQATTLINAFLLHHPHGEHTQEAKELLTTLSTRQHAEEESFAWNQALQQVSSVKNIAVALDALQKFINAYPQSMHLDNAKKQIVALEMQRYNILSPFSPKQASCTVKIKAEEKNHSYSLTGSMQEVNAELYLLKNQYDEQFYIKRSDIEKISWAPEAQYNNLMKEKKPQNAQDFLEIAQWSEKSGFSEKMLINLVMAAYLDPDNENLARQLRSNGFSLVDGRWICSCDFW